jgi:hypothetical protein
MKSSTGSDDGRGRDAFTLIEVLVTVVIVFVGVTVVLGCFRQAVTALDVSGRTVRTGLFLRESMTEAELLVARGRLPDRSGGRCSGSLAEYSWERRCRTVIPGKPFEVREVVIEVRGERSTDRRRLVSEFAVGVKP